MKTAGWTVLFFVGSVMIGDNFVYAQELPINPWAGQNQTVKISTSSESGSDKAESRQSSGMEEWAARRAAQVRQNNARIQSEYLARQKAQAEQRRREASSDEEGFLDQIGSFFADDEKAKPKQSSSSSSSSDSDFLDGYEDLIKSSKDSIDKFQKELKGLTNIEKTLKKL